jgi:acyl-coenzyme A thioesterase PaaI-like protein
VKFSETLDSVTGSQGQFEVLLTEDWSQGHSTFGGLQAAVALRAMERLLPREIPLRALQTTFLAPVPAGPVQIEARILRAGKNAVHAEARLMSQGSVTGVVVGVFGGARSSVVEIVPRQPPLTSADAVVSRTPPSGAPTFFQHFEVCVLRGGRLYSGSKDPTGIFEIGFRDGGAVTAAHVVALADVIPPLALTMLDRPAPGSSLTWMLEMLTVNCDRFSPTGFRVDAELLAARDGYTNQSAVIWGPGGEPVALSRQTMLVLG